MSEALHVSHEHPSLPGHFPGMPVVPGVVLLSHVLAELKRRQPQLEVVGVKKLKFLSLLLPEQRFTAEFAAPAADALRFKCWRDEQRTEPLLEGNLSVRSAVEPGTAL